MSAGCRIGRTGGGFMARRVFGSLLFLLSGGLMLLPSMTAQSSDAAFYADMRWRLVGPNRAGRVWAVAGVPGDPAVYFLATPAGALWKTTSGGTTWRAVSDGTIPTTGFGAVAVASSDHQTVYAATGSNILGSGVYRSTDQGETWQPAGLADTKFLTALLVDPRDANVVLAGAGSGGNFGSMVYYNNNPTDARGVYRTTDGGRTWTHALFVDAETGVVDLVSDPATPDVVFVSLNAGGRAGQGGPSLYRSSDAGATWTRLPADGLPAGAASANVAVAPGTGSRRLYALASSRGGGGLFRSDDGGATWPLMTSRTASASGHLYVDPGNPDLVYTMGTSMYRSTDGGRTLDAYKGAPGGDDPKALWIDPDNPMRMVLGADQGPAITLDGGRTWTPWYTVFNGEHYFVSADNQFPYWLYAAQQDSGTVAIRSRSDFGAIRPNDWYPVSGYEQGHIFADPFNPRYVYSHGNGHRIIRFDRETGQSGPVYTPSAEDRFGPRPGMELSPKDPHWMFAGAQYVLASNDRVTWTRISPDLTVRGAGTIVALAPSPLDVNILWAGTSNGLIHVTRDLGKTWTNVSPPRLSSEATLTLWSMEGSSHDAGTAYAAAIDLSDRHAPALFRTDDFGQTWRTIVDGLPPNVPTRVVREDPQNANLLYAGTQNGIYVSFDRGGRWQPLQLNLPRVSVNDITVHGNDLAIATWGRGLWILDDVAPLRQIEEARASTAPAFFFAPSRATRARWDNNQDTPLPPEVPTGENPPDGAILDYYLPSTQSDRMTLAIYDAAGALVREYSSTAPPPDTSMPNAPAYWFKGPDVLATSAGMHRFLWDLRYPTPPSLNYGADGNPASSTSYGIIAPAIIGHSPRQQPQGPLVLPGIYQARLVVGGRTYTRSVDVTSDPRVDVASADLEAQLAWQRALAAGITTSHDAIEEIRRLRDEASARVGSPDAPAGVKASVDAFDRAAAVAIAALASNRGLASQLASLEFADLRPTDSTVAALEAGCGRADDSFDRYRQFVRTDLVALNTALTGAGLPPLTGPAVATGGACGR
jgi:photosystem II stability/assembly factor-like uncharacterized protein